VAIVIDPGLAPGLAMADLVVPGHGAPFQPSERTPR
jgi:hypothetical protein